MNKVITILITIALLCTTCAVGESAFDLSGMTNDELAALIKAAQAELDSRNAVEQQEASEDNTLYVSDAFLTVQSTEYKSLYPDLLQAILVNNTEHDIKNAVVAFLAWDDNNLPLLIKSQFDFNAAAYVMRANYSGINMVPGSTFGEKTGVKLNESINGVATVKAIVMSYETFDGDTWSNPGYDAFIEQYAGKKLQEGN